jgi:hypothetical protein
MPKYLTDDPAFEQKAIEIANAFLQKCPDQASKFLAGEKIEGPIDDEIAEFLLKFVRDTGRVKSLHEATTVIRKIRRLVRERGGLSVNPDSKY